MTDAFCEYHPIVNIVYFLVVLALPAFVMQTGLLMISCICAAVYYFHLKRRGGVRYFGVVLGLFLITALINPLFSHRGATLLFYLPTGNPVTEEALIYGVQMGIMVFGTLLWCSCFNTVVTSEKWIEILGRVAPFFSLLLAMIFRFIPKYTGQIQKIHFARKAMGEKNTGLKDKVKNAFQTFSITTTWALENSVDTVDSMRARGYGTGRRSTYHNYRITFRDISALIWITGWGGVVLYAVASGALKTVYYPYYEVRGNVLFYAAFALLCLTPLGMEGKESFRWRRLKFKI